MPTEHYLTRRLRAHFNDLERSGAPFAATKIAGGGRFQRAGLPDWFLVFSGALVVLETKSGKNGLSPLQKREISRFMKSGAEVWVMTDYAEIVDRVSKRLSGV